MQWRAAQQSCSNVLRRTSVSASIDIIPLPQKGAQFGDAK
jgi:hypothetical protein